MSDKPKKSHQRIPQWQFLLSWIGGQVAVFLLLGAVGFLFVLFGGSHIPSMLGFLLAGLGLGWFSGWVQQWSIYKHFGHYIKGWRTISAVLTGIIMTIVQPLVLWSTFAFPDLYQDATVYPIIVAITFMSIFGAAGIGQAILLRKHIRHSWLFLLSTLVGGIIYGLPVLGDSSFFISQIAQYTVTAFTIIWLFQMSGGLDNMVSEDEAIERLSDKNYGDDADYLDDEQGKKRDTLFDRLWNMMRLAFAS